MREDRGSATAEFTMVAALLVMLSLAIIQFASAVHIRNTMIDAASTGSRFAVLADRTAEDGVQRTEDLLGGSAAARYTQQVSYEYIEAEHGTQLRITVSAQLPVLGVLPGVGELEVSGSAYDFQ